MHPLLAGAGVAAAAAGLAAWAALHPAAQLFGPTLRRVPGGAGGVLPAAALTFDDGPSPRNTPPLLELLERHRVPATFFLVGQYVAEFPELAREIAARGHALGNHTYTHPSLVWASAARVVRELERCQQAIAAATGVCAEWMRPPYGYRSPHVHRVARRLGLRGVAMWSLNARDWRARSARDVARRLLPARAGDIVLLHDGAPPGSGGPRASRAVTLEALAEWLPRWNDAGLKFVTLNEVNGT